MRAARARGYTLFELLIVIATFGLLAGVLLERLAYYQEAVERISMESTLRLVKTGLQIRLAELIITHREREAGVLEEVDPTQWLERPPVNYGGAYGGQPRPGTWYFDQGTRELVYVVNTGDRLEIGAEKDEKVLRFRARLLKNRLNVPGGTLESTSGVTLIAVKDYRWP